MEGDTRTRITFNISFFKRKTSNSVEVIVIIKYNLKKKKKKETRIY